MFPQDILRNILRLFKMMTKGFQSNISLNEKEGKKSSTNNPLPVTHRNQCPHCKLDIPEGARVCHHCHQFVSIRFNLANIITVLASVAAVAMSVYSLYVTATQAQAEKNIESRRFLIETLRNLQQIQDELQVSRERAVSESLTEKEILLLNYYQVLSRTLAQYIKQEPYLFSRARCTYTPYVRLRQSPTTKSAQLGMIMYGEEVFVLGKFSYGKGETWYYIASSDQQKIGWVYKFIEFLP